MKERMDDPFPEGLLADIERVIMIDTQPPGRDLYDVVFDAPLMFPLQRRAEMAAMMRLARSVGGTNAKAD